MMHAECWTKTFRRVLRKTRELFIFYVTVCFLYPSYTCRQVFWEFRLKIWIGLPGNWLKCLLLCRTHVLWSLENTCNIEVIHRYIENMIPPYRYHRGGIVSSPPDHHHHSSSPRQVIVQLKAIQIRIGLATREFLVQVHTFWMLIYLFMD